MANPLSRILGGLIDAGFRIVEGAIELIGDFGKTAWDAVRNAYRTLWKNIHQKIIEKIFNLLGITDRTIYYVFNSSFRIYPDEVIKDYNSLIGAVLRAIQVNGDVVEYIVTAILSGSVNSARQFIYLGENRTKNGLPKFSGIDEFIDNLELIQLFESRLYPIRKFEVASGFIHEYFWVFYNLAKDYNYNDFQSDLDLGNIFANDSIIPIGTNYETVTINGTLWELASDRGINNWSYDPNGDGTYTIHLISTDNTGTRTTFLLNAPIPETGDFIYITFRSNVISSRTTWFLYQIGIGEYDDLTPTVDEELENLVKVAGNRRIYLELDFCPIVPLIENFIAVNEDKDSEQYKESTTLVRQFGFSVDNLLKTLDDPDNPQQIKDLRNAYLMMGINIHTQSQEGIRALFVYFTLLSIYSQVKITEYARGTDLNPAFNVLKIEQGFFNQHQVYNYIQIITTSGKIGKVNYGITEIVPFNELTKAPSEFRIKYQITETEYSTVIVSGLHLVTVILTDPGGLDHAVEEISTDPEANRAFNIPVAFKVIDNELFTYTEKENIIRESLLINMHTLLVEELRYYETPEFIQLTAGLLKVVAVIVLIFSFGTASNLSQFLWGLATVIAANYAIGYVLKKLLIKYAEDDQKRTLVLLAAFAAYLYVGFKFGKLETAEALLYAVNGLFGATSVAIAVVSQELSEEIRQESLTSKERWEELEEAQAALDNPTNLELWELERFAQINSYESPTNYIERSLTTNVAPLILEQIESYHDNLLRLPELDVNSFRRETVYNLSGVAA